MKFLECLSSFFLLFICFTIFGQEIVIVDNVSELPLEGVALYNESKTIGTLSNQEGVADLSIFSIGETVYVQIYGFETRSFSISSQNLNSRFQFVMQTEKQFGPLIFRTFSLVLLF